MPNKRKQAAAAFVFGVAAATASVMAHADPELSVYRSTAPTGPADVDGFSQWLGAPVTLAFDYEDGSTWDEIAGPAWQLAPWSQWVQAERGRNLVLSVPLLAGPANRSGPDGVPGTSDDVSLAQCAAGQYDAYWTKLAHNLSYYSLDSAYLRLGWEMDGTGWAWSAPPGSGQEGNYAACFRHVVQVMRNAEAANQWKFVWNPGQRDSAYLNATWPGDAYVDMVGPDIYDQSWATDTYPYPSSCDASCRLTRQQNAWNGYSELQTLVALRNFAAAHGKPMAIPEWGVASRPDGHGGGDNTYFMQSMYDFIMDPGNNVAFHAYFDVTMAGGYDFRIAPTTANFPQSAALYKKLFAPDPVSGDPATGSNDTTPPTVALTSPADGSVISRRSTLTLSATASDNVGVASVDFLVNSKAICHVIGDPYQCTYKAGAKPMRSYTVTVKATDTAGNIAQSSRTFQGTR